jgi:hypothetical protein
MSTIITVPLQELHTPIVLSDAEIDSVAGGVIPLIFVAGAFLAVNAGLLVGGAVTYAYLKATGQWYQ